LVVSERPAAIEELAGRPRVVFDEAIEEVHANALSLAAVRRRVDRA
jgi:hypothetical protein